MKVKVSTVLDPEKTILRMVKSAEVITVQKSELEIVVLAISAKMPPLYSMVVQKGGKKKKIKLRFISKGTESRTENCKLMMWPQFDCWRQFWTLFQGKYSRAGKNCRERWKGDHRFSRGFVQDYIKQTCLKKSAEEKRHNTAMQNRKQQRKLSRTPLFSPPMQKFEKAGLKQSGGILHSRWIKLWDSSPYSVVKTKSVSRLKKVLWIHLQMKKSIKTY